MDITVIKKENGEEQVVKVEEHVGEGVTTVVLQNISEFGEVHEQIVSADSIPYLLKNYGENSDGNLQIAQVDDGQYTYIIENPEAFEDGTEFEIADGEHYIIEEYHENCEEESQDSQYETVYIQQMDEPQQAAGIEPSEVYTISEEIEDHYSEEENNQPDDDDHQMAIVEETEAPPEKPAQDEKPLPTIIQKEKLQVQIKQAKVTLATTQKPMAVQSVVPARQPIKQEADLDHQQEQRVMQLEESVYENPEVNVAKEGSMPAEQTEMGEPEENVYGDKPEIIYECSICAKTFKTSTGVKRHISVVHWKEEEEKQNEEKKDVLSFSLCPCCGEPSDSAHTTGDFQCEQCSKLFIQQNSLDRHISIEHPEGNSYNCIDCKKTFENKDELIEHTRVHSLKSVKCEECGREFTRKYHLDRHIGQTGCMGLPKQVYDCRVCGKTFTRKDNLAEHLKGHAGIVNRKKKKFTCEFCSKDFNGLALLNIHVRTHTGERPYACDICDKRFPSSGAMKKHRRMHTGEKPYTCPQCGNRFAAKETLNRHWRTHTGEKPHQCKFCGKSFIQPAQLRAHIFHHTGENAYTCPICNRAFNRKLRLTTHIKFMHEGAEPLTCPQDGCTKNFFRKEDIHRHLLTHTGEKPYKCEVCNKAFVVKSSLKIHQLTHRSEAPVTCEVCSRAFIRQDCLMRHMRARHRDVLEDIVANAEKKRLQKQLLEAVSNAANKDTLRDTIIWNELTLTESIKELLSLLVDEECLAEFGHPEAPVDKVLDSVIKRCGHTPASEIDFDYIGKMRENAKLLFTVVIDDEAVKELLNNQTVDEVIMHVLKLAKKQVEGTLDEDEVDQKPNVDEMSIEMGEISKSKSSKKIGQQNLSKMIIESMDFDENDEADVDNPDLVVDSDLVEEHGAVDEREDSIDNSELYNDDAGDSVADDGGGDPDNVDNSEETMETDNNPIEFIKYENGPSEETDGGDQ